MLEYQSLSESSFLVWNAFKKILGLTNIFMIEKKTRENLSVAKSDVEKIYKKIRNNCYDALLDIKLTIAVFEDMTAYS